MATVTVVADTGPIIAFAKVDQLALLATLFGTLAISPVVKQELFAKQSPESKRIRQALSQLLIEIPVDEVTPRVAFATRNLDSGEAESIALAAHLNTPLLIDDASGRKVATKLGVAVVGTIGVLLRAKQLRMVEAVLPIALEMRKRGYWFSDDLLEQAVVLTGEDVYPQI